MPESTIKTQEQVPNRSTILPEANTFATLFRELVANCGILGIAESIIHDGQKYLLEVTPGHLQLITCNGTLIVITPDGITYETRDHSVCHKVEGDAQKKLVEVLQAFLQSSRAEEIARAILNAIINAVAPNKKPD